jgi:Rod binding domain-containing protein
MIPLHPSLPSLAAAQQQPQASDALRDVAERLETAFLSEMLKSADLGESAGSFGGGVGEEQFASFLREAQAREMVRAGGIGLAEVIHDALKADSDAAR